MSWLFLVALEYENNDKEIVRQENFVEGEDFSKVVQYAEEQLRLEDYEIIEVKRCVPICGHVD